MNLNSDTLDNNNTVDTFMLKNELIAVAASLDAALITLKQHNPDFDSNGSAKILRDAFDSPETLTFSQMIDANSIIENAKSVGSSNGGDNPGGKPGDDATLERVTRISDLCVLTGKFNELPGFIASGKTVDEVRAELMVIRRAELLRVPPIHVHSQAVDAGVKQKSMSDMAAELCKKVGLV